MTKLKIGLALGSGGARGWCHIGVLRALEDMGIRPDMIAGCSMGALVGAAYAGGRLDALEDWVSTLTPARFVRLLDIRPGSGGLIAGGQILSLIRELGLPEHIEDLPMPFAAVATEMETGGEIWLREGPLNAAVRASVSMPGVISPYRVQGKWLLDGGLTNPVPVSLARAMGADVIVAVNPNAKLHGRLWQRTPSSWQTMLKDLPEGVAALLPQAADGDSPPSYAEVISVSIDAMTEQIRRARLAGEPPHVLLNADLSALSVMELHRGAEAMAEGRRIVQAQADWIAAACKGAGGA